MRMDTPSVPTSVAKYHHVAPLYSPAMPLHTFPRPAQRFDLASRPVEGKHVLHAESLPQGMIPHQGPELPDDLGVVAGGEACLDAQFDELEPEFFEAVNLTLQTGDIHQVRVGSAPPHGERRSGQLQCRIGVRGEEGSRLFTRLRGCLAVDGVGDGQRVLLATPLDPTTQDGAKVRDIGVDRRSCGLRRALPPEAVHDPFNREARPAGDGEKRQQGSLLGPSQAEGLAPDEYLEGTEDSDVRCPDDRLVISGRGDHAFHTRDPTDTTLE